MKAGGIFLEPARLSYGQILNSEGLNITDEFTIFARINMMEWGQGLRDIIVKAPSMSWPPANFRFGVSAFKLGCILDRLKYGDVPYDFVNGVYGEYLGTPRWVVKKPLRVISVRR